MCAQIIYIVSLSLRKNTGVFKNVGFVIDALLDYCHNTVQCALFFNNHIHCIFYTRFNKHSDIYLDESVLQCDSVSHIPIARMIYRHVGSFGYL